MPRKGADRQARRSFASSVFDDLIELGWGSEGCQPVAGIVPPAGFAFHGPRRSAPSLPCHNSIGHRPVFGQSLPLHHQPCPNRREGTVFDWGVSAKDCLDRAGEESINRGCGFFAHR
ncbi:MAG: hypothetical protein OZSIB_0197 [Candidatus Ozemobacter sibiricus]|uniref:Uncharacterized protein n=1 Tax=Candidatus Ozemobacter sibiricus TaxID=2268124 RepID=A0A367ZMS2_9BACT|nr:MAG: hypothetical protein OZSIB_0197 [Candidatus Ozemobacter sibiricus]